MKKKLTKEEKAEESKSESTEPGLNHDDCYQEGIKPAIFKQICGKGHTDFSTGQQ